MWYMCPKAAYRRPPSSSSIIEGPHMRLLSRLAIVFAVFLGMYGCTCREPSKSLSPMPAANAARPRGEGAVLMYLAAAMRTRQTGCRLYYRGPYEAVSPRRLLSAPSRVPPNAGASATQWKNRCRCGPGGFSGRQKRRGQARAIRPDQGIHREGLIGNLENEVATSEVQPG